MTAFDAYEAKVKALNEDLAKKLSSCYHSMPLVTRFLKI